MLFALICRDKPDHSHIRNNIRPEHLNYLNGMGNKLYQAGPLLDNSYTTPIGSLIIIEASTSADAESIAAHDPYAIAGLFESVDIFPWKKIKP